MRTEAADLRLVLLTREGPEHRYVANRLAEEHPLSDVIIDEGLPKPLGQRVLSLSTRYTPSQALSRALGKGLAAVSQEGKQRSSELRRILGHRCESFERPDLLRRVQGVSMPRTQEQFGALEPDVLLVYGTAIVPDVTLATARLLAINMHTGISPFYTGTDCAFWPLVNREPDMLGATVHECTAAVDGGPIYRVQSIELSEDDTRWSVFAKTVKLGAELYVDAVRDLRAGRLEGHRQDPAQRRTYRSVDRGWREEWQVSREIRAGLISHHVRHARSDS
jgi:methionyl-tRNA formyltransferase